MRVLIIGASGRTGSLAVRYALDKGYTVTVLVRRASSITAQGGMTVIEGSPYVESDVRVAFEQHKEDPIQAVIVALAASRASDSPFAKSLAPEDFIQASVRNIKRQMRSHKVKRLVVMSAFGSGSSWTNFPVAFKALFMMSNMRHELADHDAVDRELREDNDIDWTLAKPTLLKGEQTEIREFGESGKGIGMTMTCSREGVARWLVDAVESKAHIQQACTLAN